MTAPRTLRRRGLTLVEVTIAVGLLATVLVGLELVMGSARRQYDTGTRAMDLERRGTLTLSRIVNAVRAADPNSISVVPVSPLTTNEITFQLNEGYQGKQVVWSPPIRVRLEPDGRILRTVDPGKPSAVSTFWGRGVAPLLEGELPNGLDDNGNGLIDEPGFCISREGQLLTIGLTLRDERPGGRFVSRTWSTRLHCRN